MEPSGWQYMLMKPGIVSKEKQLHLDKNLQLTDRTGRKLGMERACTKGGKGGGGVRDKERGVCPSKSKERDESAESS